MSREALLRVAVVLHRTRLAENVGTAARAVANMGLGGLVLADPAGFDLTRARRIAAEAGEDVEQAEVAPSLEAALAPYARVIATTARPRDDLPMAEPESAARYALEAAETGLRVAVLFGDERLGLPRAVLDRAHLVSRVPTEPTRASLNLGMAVLLHAWELRRAALADAPPGAAAPRAASPAEAPMSAEDLARLRGRARALLLDVGYLNPQQPDRILGELERLLLRGAPTEREARLLLALVRQLEWAVGRRSP